MNLHPFHMHCQEVFVQVVSLPRWFPNVRDTQDWNQVELSVVQHRFDRLVSTSKGLRPHTQGDEAMSSTDWDGLTPGHTHETHVPQPNDFPLPL
jgi:hypothetical protein